MNENYEYDFFVSHASEDKDVAEPLVGKLSQTGAKVWYDRIELTIGDSLREKIACCDHKTEFRTLWDGSKRRGGRWSPCRKLQ